LILPSVKKSMVFNVESFVIFLVRKSPWQTEDGATCKPLEGALERQVTVIVTTSK